MDTFFAFLLTGGWFIFVYRILGWFRRRLAEHRKRLEAAGWVENNPGRRLRGDKTVRIASLIYVAVGSVAYVSISAGIPRFTPFIAAVLTAWLGSSFIAFFPAALFFGCYTAYTEWTHPQGDIALKLRDMQWHPAAQPVLPNGEYGSSSIIDAIKAGLTNPTGLGIGRRRVVVQEAK